MKLTRFGDFEKVITFPVFAMYRVYIVMTDDLQKSYDGRIFEERDLSNSDALSVGLREHANSVIFLKRGCSAGDVAHESWHTVRRILLLIGAELEDEIVAYLLDYLVNEITKFQSAITSSQV